MIKLDDVSYTYKAGNRVLKDININIEDGEFVYIMGKSGAGKSTLFKLLLKQMNPTSGSITVHDMPLGPMPRRFIPKYRRIIGIVFQDFRLLEDRNVYENVAFAQRIIGERSSKIRENVPEALRVVGLSSKYKFKPSQLSGGEKQRVAIARAIINNPDIILADEPTGNLDYATAADIMKLLEEINSRGTTVVVITHSEDIVSRFKHRVIRLDKGTVTGDARIEEDA